MSDADPRIAPAENGADLPAGDPDLHIAIAESDAEILASLPVLLELRPHLTDPAAALARIHLLMTEGFRLAVLRSRGEVVGCAGYRILDTLARGRFLYVDDLVVAGSRRSAGLGDHLFDWLVDQARLSGCTRVDLDSALHRTEAHRFYFRKRMSATGLHFALSLS